MLIVGSTQFATSFILISDLQLYSLAILKPLEPKGCIVSHLKALTNSNMYIVKSAGVLLTLIRLGGGSGSPPRQLTVRHF